MTSFRRAALAAACAVAVLRLPAGADEKKGGKGRGAALPAGVTAVPVSGVREPSGVACDARAGRLYVVGDEGALAELDAEGRTLRAFAVRGNLEDVTVHGPSKTLVLLSEAGGELVVFDPAAGAERARVRLDAADLLGEAPRERAHGFEGLFYDERGDSFLLTHQRAPAAVIAVSFDPSRPPASIGAAQVAARWPRGRHEDLTAITGAAGRVLVVAEAADRLLVFDARGGLQSELDLPGLQQEGACVDAAGRLWLADDRHGHLLRVDGGTAALLPRTPGS